MKKILLLIMVFVLFSSCSLQEKMNAELFSERFLIEINDDFEIKDIFNNNQKSEIYLNDKKGKEYVIKSESDSCGNVCKITLTGNGTQSEFNNLADKIIKTYSPDIESENVLRHLFINSFDYTETQWYYVTSAKKDNILFFSIENKKLSSPKNTEFTLKSNDITITKGSE